MSRFVELFGLTPNRPSAFNRHPPSGRDVLKLVNPVNSLSSATSTDSRFPNATFIGSHFKPRLSMHDPVTFSLFLACISLVGGMLWILSKLPPLSSVETITEKFVWRPTTAAQFKRDKDLLVRYRQAYAWELFVGMTTLNIMLQTFCVPGSATTLNVLAGCLFHDMMPGGEFLVALPFAVLCTTAASFCCYLISYLTACQIVARRFPSKIDWLQKKIAANSSSFFFLLSLRLSPLIPGWLFSIAAPLLPMSAGRFGLVTLLACIPPSALTVQIGAVLSRMQAGESVVRANLPRLAALGILCTAVSLPAMRSCL